MTEMTMERYRFKHKPLDKLPYPKTDIVIRFEDAAQQVTLIRCRKGQTALQYEIEQRPMRGTDRLYDKNGEACSEIDFYRAWKQAKEALSI